eukprot:9243279-Ditylum_brightwellii.AAC.1
MDGDPINRSPDVSVGDKADNPNQDEGSRSDGSGDKTNIHDSVQDPNFGSSITSVITAQVVHDNNNVGSVHDTAMSD